MVRRWRAVVGVLELFSGFHITRVELLLRSHLEIKCTYVDLTSRGFLSTQRLLNIILFFDYPLPLRRPLFNCTSLLLRKTTPTAHFSSAVKSTSRCSPLTYTTISPITWHTLISLPSNELSSPASYPVEQLLLISVRDRSNPILHDYWKPHVRHGLHPSWHRFCSRKT